MSNSSTNVLPMNDTSSIESYPLYESDNEEYQRQFQWMEIQHEVWGHRPGGFHPVDLGDLIKERYIVVHRLGLGGNATIWLARDEVTETYVALKIQVAGSSDSPEAAVLRHLQQDGGHEFFFQILDDFIVQGPNGQHLCVVMELASMSLYDAAGRERWVEPLPLPIARDICGRLIRAVAHMHQAGVVHGDLHSGNVLIGLPELSTINELSISEFYAKYGHPETQPIKDMFYGQEPNPSYPRNYVHQLWFDTNPAEFQPGDLRVCLADFGEAFMPDSVTRYRSYTPEQNKPPEALFLYDVPRSFPGDIWSLGNLLYGIFRANRGAFGSRGDGPTTDELVLEWVETLGKLPEEWWERWENREEFCLEDGTLIGEDAEYAEDLKARCQRSQAERKRLEMETMSEDEFEAFLDLLKHVFTFEPERRATIDEILDSKWVRKWVFPGSSTTPSTQAAAENLQHFDDGAIAEDKSTGYSPHFIKSLAKALKRIPVKIQAKGSRKFSSETSIAPAWGSYFRPHHMEQFFEKIQAAKDAGACFALLQSYVEQHQGDAWSESTATEGVEASRPELLSSPVLQPKRKASKRDSFDRIFKRHKVSHGLLTPTPSPIDQLHKSRLPPSKKRRSFDSISRRSLTSLSSSIKKKIKSVGSVLGEGLVSIGRTAIAV